MAVENLELNIDFTDRAYNVNENIQIMQGGGLYNLTLKLTNGGVALSGENTVSLFVVTSDSLNYFKTVNKVRDVVINGNVIVLSDADKKMLFKTKGECQIIATIGGLSSLPFNYYVIPNPAYELIK